MESSGSRGSRGSGFVRAMSEATSGRRPGRLASLLFEGDGGVEMARELGLKPITVVLMYGPPAAGKGAAQKDAPKFAGVDAQGDYKAFVEKSQGFVQEEDAAMVRFTTGVLPVAVFSSLFDRVQAGEKFEQIVGEYFHVNESGRKFELSKILSPNAFRKMYDAGREAGAEQFKNFKNTEAYFTQARGFSNPGEGMPGLPDGSDEMLGPNDGSPTVGARLMAAKKYMQDIKEEVRAIVKGSTVADSPFATIYLADQAGESTANVERIAELGRLKNDEEFPGLKLIGIYIHQPAERTRITNLHRAATGGRRVAQSEVDRIFAAAPEIEDGRIVSKGPAIEAMEKAGFDQIHVYYPPDPFDPEKSKAEDGRSVEDAICEPLGDGTGALDIEGCEDSGTPGKAKSLAGLEQLAIEKAGIEVDNPKSGIPEEVSEEDSEKIVAALGELGYRVTREQLGSYLRNVQAPGIRGGGEHGKVPWGNALFGGKGSGRNPTERITIKSESRSKRKDDAIIMERWLRLAGIIR